MLQATRVMRFDKFTKELDQSLQKLFKNRRISKSALAHVCWYDGFFMAIADDPQWQDVSIASLTVIERFKKLAEAYNSGQSTKVTDSLAQQFADAVNKNTEEVRKWLST